MTSAGAAIRQLNMCIGHLVPLEGGHLMSERWICSICGYARKGAAPPTQCPSCGAPFTAFERRERNPKAKYRQIQIAEPRPAGFRYVIVGNSAAGRSAVKAIQALHPKGHITVISEEPVGFYSRPTLPDYIGGMPRDDFFSIGETYPDEGLQMLRGRTAQRIDTDAKAVVCDNGDSVPYDALLLATGSGPVQIPWPGSDADGIAYFRTFADAERILAVAQHAQHAVVVGGGLLGLEFVRAFHVRGLRITQLVRETRVGAPGLDEHAGALVDKALLDWGVDLVLEDEVDRFEAEQGKVCAVNTKGGRTIECELVGIAVGARPRIKLAQEAGLHTDRGILVDAGFRTSAPHIYAAGDCAQAYDIVRQEQFVNTSWKNSQDQGEFAGIGMVGGAGQYPGALAMNFQLAAGLPFCAIGLSNPQDPETYDIDTTTDEDAREYRKFVRRDGVLVGACFVGDLGPAVEAEAEIRQAAVDRPAAPAAPQPSPVEEEAGGTEPQIEEVSSMHKMTQDNLEAAFAGESQAHIKYMNFAAKADEDGKQNVARLFRAASFAEQVHATRHLEVLDGIADTAGNLSEAADGEQFEIDEMYPAFMAVAEEQEETDANEAFNYALQAEKQHLELYDRCKKAVAAGGDAVLEEIQVCGYCGYTLEGEAPAKCPICKAPKKEFVKF